MAAGLAAALALGTAAAVGAQAGGGEPGATPAAAGPAAVDPAAAGPAAVPDPVPVPAPTPVPEPAPIPEPPPLSTEVPLGPPPPAPAPGGGAAGPAPGAAGPGASGAAAAPAAGPEVGAEPGAPVPRATGPIPPGAEVQSPTEAVAELRERLEEAEDDRDALAEQVATNEETIAALSDELALREVEELAHEAARQDRIAGVEAAGQTMDELGGLLAFGTETDVEELLGATATELQAFEASAREASRSVEADRAAAALDNLAYAREALARDDLFEARIALELARLHAAQAQDRALSTPSPPTPP